MKVSQYNQKKYYSEGSGVPVLVEPNITMKLNDYGIYEEQVNLNDDQELHPNVEYVSPYLNDKVNESDISDLLYKNIEGIHYDNSLGYYLSLYAGYVKEGDYRLQASSGGLGTWIFKELFERDLIDGVIHVKRNSDLQSEIMFKYEISRSVEEIREGAKTKYYPLELSEVLKLVKETPGRYAIIGIPSFIMSVRLLSQVEPIFKERIHYTIGLICGHQKSSKFCEAIAWQVGIQPKDLVNIDFRKKLPNRPALDYGVELTGIINNQQVTITKPMKDIIVQDWGEGYFKQVSSDYTDDVMNETSDMTIGDAWLPQYENDWEGTSITIIRHPTLQNIIQEGIDSDKLKLDIMSVEQVYASQAAHFRHTRDELSYRLAKKDQEKKWRPTLRVKASLNTPVLRQKVQDFRIHFAQQSHSVYKEAVERQDFSYFEKRMKKLSRQYKQIYKKIKFKRLGLIGSIKDFFKK
jgi:coenzyme F420 hydrogenase subunit beta